VLVADPKDRLGASAWRPRSPRRRRRRPERITPAAITLQQIDVNTSALTGPATVTLPPQSPISLQFPGYGLALLTITPA
jgi:hypothetical protein